MPEFDTLLPRVRCIHDKTGEVSLVVFWCPGCNETHVFTVRDSVKPRPLWTWNGDLRNPTFSPSLLYPEKQIRCHLFVKDGVIEYCADCGHNLAGCRVPLPELVSWQSEW